MSIHVFTLQCLKCGFPNTWRQAAGSGTHYMCKCGQRLYLNVDGVGKITQFKTA